MGAGHVSQNGPLAGPSRGLNSIAVRQRTACMSLPGKSANSFVVCVDVLSNLPGVGRVEFLQSQRFRPVGQRHARDREMKNIFLGEHTCIDPPKLLLRIPHHRMDRNLGPGRSKSLRRQASRPSGQSSFLAAKLREKDAGWRWRVGLPNESLTGASSIRCLRLETIPNCG